jgi:flagellar biosynthesis protein FliQ
MWERGMTGVGQLTEGALMAVFTIAGPILAVILVIGVVVSLFLAVTQINEPTLSFVPKFLATGVTLVVLGPWLLRQLETFATDVLTSLPRILQ